MNLRKAITILSYAAVLLLLMPATAKGLIIALVFLILGSALFISQPLRARKTKGALYLLPLTVVFIAHFGYQFPVRWLPSSKVQAIASILHISTPVLLAVAAACLSLLACYFLLGVLPLLPKVLVRVGATFIHDVLPKLSDLAATYTFTRDLLCCCLAAVATIVLSQNMLEVDKFSMGFQKFFYGALIVSVVIGILYTLTGNIRISTALGTGLFMIISIVNVYIFQFRTRLLEPVDIFSVRTAWNVASNYSLFPIPTSILIACIKWYLLLICIFQLCKKSKCSPSWKKRVSLLAGCIVGIFVIVNYTANLKTYHWHKDGAAFNGYILDFVAKFKETFISEPDGYSEERISELSDRYGQTVASSDSEKDYPHIIVIMDESFSDLNVFGEISTDNEVTPFLSSLKQDAITGYALSSVYGGNTANSEFEFLTGNSMAWLSPNSVPYQQYIRSPSCSMVSNLKSNYGYQCIAMHPYYASGWNRPEAYRQLGFDASYFLEDFPQENYIRSFISDQEMFETMVKIFESQKEEPLFLFGVSMQNHGSYDYTGENYRQSISLVGYERDYPIVEQYLSLLHETDLAVEYLINYFSNVEDDVVIVFFGDHQPNINAAFYREVDQSNSTSPYGQQKKYMVPFYIWANYDIDEKHVECTSLNYLSSYVYEAAGIPLPAYNQFLSEMEAVIPAVNVNGFYSLNAQDYLPFDMASEEEQAWLEMYEQLQYNNLFGGTHRNKTFFPILE